MGGRSGDFGVLVFVCLSLWDVSVCGVGCRSVVPAASERRVFLGGGYGHGEEAEHQAPSLFSAGPVQRRYARER